MKKKGFTLVELSIVLVIIGLLIGGILVGQSLIESAGITKAVKQLGEYDLSIATFKSKYKQLPGDSNLFGTCSPGFACNNDKVTDGSGYESGYAWRHLSLGVGLKSRYGKSYLKFNPFGPPWSTIDETVCPILNSLDNRPDAAAPCLYIFYQPWNGVGVYRYWGGAMSAGGQDHRLLKPRQAAAFDKKLDNGTTSGKISAGSGNCASGGIYTVANDAYECTLSIQIGIISGENH